MNNNEINKAEPASVNEKEWQEGEKKGGFKAKLDNFLYHYKWHTVVCAFLAFVLLWVVISSFGKMSDDAYIGYIGEYSYSSLQMRDISRVISDALDYDKNEDGKTVIDFHSIYYMTEEQMLQAAEEAEARGDEFGISYIENSKNYDTFISELTSRDCAIWFVSEQVYETLDKSKLMPLSDILGYTPEGAVDEYAVKSSELDITLSAAKEIRYRSYLVLRMDREYSFIMGNDRALEAMRDDMELYRRIVEYEK